MRLQSEPVISPAALQLLREAASALDASASLEEVLQRLARSAALGVADSVGGPAAAVVWGEQGSELVALAESDHSDGHAGSRLPLSEALRKVLDGGEPALLPLSDLPRPLREAAAGADGGSLLVAVPINAGGGRFGLLTVSVNEREPPVDLEVLSVLSALAGPAIAGATRLQLERRLGAGFEALTGLIAEGLAARDLEEAGALVVARLARLAGAERAVLALRDEIKPGLWVKAASEPVDLLNIEPGEGAVGHALSEGRPVLVNAGAPWAARADLGIAGDAPHLLAVPVALGEEPVGLLAVASRVRPFSRPDLQLVAMFATALTGLLESFRLRQELAQARQTADSFYHGLACGAVTHDSRGRLVVANWAALNVTGLSAARLDEEGVFGAGWEMEAENGTPIPLPLRPPESVVRSGRPVHGLTALVTPPGGEPRWLRIDSRPIEERRRLKSVVTTFFECPAPERPAARRKRTSASGPAGASS